MEPAPELAEFARDVLKSYDEFDASTLIATFSHEPHAIAIGTDPNEWWQGFEAFSAVIRVQFQEFQTHIQRRFEIEEIVAEREGTVGWVSVRANFVLGDNPPNPVRFTIVVHREGTYWRIVQWHGSIPIAYGGPYIQSWPSNLPHYAYELLWVDQVASPSASSPGVWTATLEVSTGSSSTGVPSVASGNLVAVGGSPSTDAVGGTNAPWLPYAGPATCSGVS